MKGADHGEFLLSGFSVKDWSTLIMPANGHTTIKVEPEDVKNDDDEPNWFPFEWFLDHEDESTDGLQVLDTNSVMRNHNKNPKLQLDKSVVEQIANPEETLDHKLGLKATDRVAMISFPNIQALLTDPNVFIADSGATTHATATKIGMKNLQNGEEGEYIEIASGLHEAAMQIGDLSCIIWNQYGQELQNVTLNDITYSPSLKFNLFSTTKLQRDRWKMIGDYSSITMQKGSITLCFDIVIPQTRAQSIVCTSSVDARWRMWPLKVWVILSSPP
jgi:hypothetical protein